MTTITDPDDYHQHELYISHLKSIAKTSSSNTELMMKLRDAREHMKDNFVLSYRLWKDWIHDEISIASTASERRKVIELYKQATEQLPVHIPLWKSYLSYAIRCHLHLFASSTEKQDSVSDGPHIIKDVVDYAMQDVQQGNTAKNGMTQQEEQDDDDDDDDTCLFEEYPNPDLIPNTYDENNDIIRKINPLEDSVVISKENLIDIFHTAQRNTGHHVGESHQVWNIMKNYHWSHLEKHFSEPQRQVKINHLRCFFLERLSVAHTELDATFSDYSSFETKFDNEHYMERIKHANNIVNKTKQELETINLSTFEMKLKSLKSSSDHGDEIAGTTTTTNTIDTNSNETLQVYMDYIQAERSTSKINSFRLRSLFERAIQDIPFETKLWSMFISFMMTNMRIHSALLDIVNRACKTNPWSCEIWCHSLCILSQLGEPCDFIYQKAYHFMARLGSIETVSSVIRMYAASLKTHQEITGVFQSAVQGWVQKISEPSIELYQHLYKPWINIETHIYKNTTLVRQLYQSLTKSLGNQSIIWVDYIHFEKDQTDTSVSKLRSIYKQTLNRHLIQPNILIEDWKSFEECHLFDKYESRNHGMKQDNCYYEALDRIYQYQLNFCKEMLLPQHNYSGGSLYVAQSYDETVSDTMVEKEVITLEKLEKGQTRNVRSAVVFKAEVKEQQSVSSNNKRKIENSAEDIQQPSKMKSAISTSAFSSSSLYSLSKKVEDINDDDKCVSLHKRQKKDITTPTIPLEEYHTIDHMNAGNMVYVKGLDLTTDEAIIHSLFGEFGKIVDVLLGKEEESNQEQKIALIEFEHAEQVKKAYQFFKDSNNLSIQRCIPKKKVWNFSSTKESRKIFVSNLPLNTSKRELREFFFDELKKQQAGKVESNEENEKKDDIMSWIKEVRLVNRPNKCFAYIEFTNDHAANLAVKRVNGLQFQGNKVSVAISNPSHSSSSSVISSKTISTGVSGGGGLSNTYTMGNSLQFKPRVSNFKRKKMI